MTARPSAPDRQATEIAQSGTRGEEAFKGPSAFITLGTSCIHVS